MNDLAYLTLTEARRGLAEKQFSCRELVQTSLDRIERHDKDIKAFLTVCRDEALAQADAVDRKIARGEAPGALEGIPYSAKDVFSTKGVRTTASSRIIGTYIPPYSATAIERLAAAGAILVGKTNNDAFGFGSSTENSDFQVTRNPWNTARVPGGSSGGSAAAVASGMGMFSLAEDTGGSIRQPASFCNVTGIKVTYGRVPRYGVIAYGSSLDTIGVLARSAEDAAFVLEVIAGRDPRDATTLHAPVPAYHKELAGSVKGLRVGVPREYFSAGIDAEVESAVRGAIDQLAKLGADVRDVSLPYTKYAIPAYYLSGMSEVSANLARYDGVRFGFSYGEATSVPELYAKTRGTGFGPEVKRRIMLGTYALSAGYYDAYYKKAQQVRNLIKQDFDRAFTEADALVAPVSPFPPFAVGEKLDDPLQMWLADAYTVTINPAGVPALAVPCGFTKTGLPLGMQIVGPQLSEPLLFRVGHAYQQATEWHRKTPILK